MSPHPTTSSAPLSPSTGLRRPSRRRCVTTGIIAGSRRTAPSLVLPRHSASSRTKPFSKASHLALIWSGSTTSNDGQCSRAADTLRRPSNRRKWQAIWLRSSVICAESRGSAEIPFEPVRYRWQRTLLHQASLLDKRKSPRHSWAPKLEFRANDRQVGTNVIQITLGHPCRPSYRDPR
jgi:hypothetical protein